MFGRKTSAQKDAKKDGGSITVDKNIVNEDGKIKPEMMDSLKEQILASMGEDHHGLGHVLRKEDLDVTIDEDGALVVNIITPAESSGVALIKPQRRFLLRY